MHLMAGKHNLFVGVGRSGYLFRYHPDKGFLYVSILTGYIVFLTWRTDDNSGA